MEHTSYCEISYTKYKHTNPTLHFSGIPDLTLALGSCAELCVARGTAAAEITIVIIAVKQETSSELAVVFLDAHVLAPAHR